MDLQVTGIVKRDHFNPHERIQALCGPGWGQKSETAIIAELERTAPANTYYVNVRGYRADVIVATRLGRKYLKTRSDGESPDNLLSLPSCT
jgi:hypothetical protein